MTNVNIYFIVLWGISVRGTCTHFQCVYVLEPSPHQQVILRVCENLTQLRHYLPRDSISKGFILYDTPTLSLGNLDACHRLLPALLINRLQIRGFHNFLLELYMPVESPECYLYLGPNGYKSEVPRTSSMCLINLLEHLTELRETFYLLDYQFVIRVYSSGTARWKT